MRKPRGDANPSGADCGQPSRLRYALLGAALCALTILAYSNSFSAGFAFDNKPLILEDQRVHAATSENLDLILHRTYWWPRAEAGLYRPVTTLSYLLNYAVLGNAEKPFGYHCFNLLLQIANVLLVYLLAAHFIRKLWPPVFVAALWAAHPLLTESVTNIVGRADLLSGLGILGGLLLYIRGARAKGLARVACLAGLLCASALAAFSKESGVVLCGLIVLIEACWWTKGRSPRSLLYGLLAALPPALWMLWQRWSLLAAYGSGTFPFLDNPIVGAGFWAGKLAASAVLSRYLWLILWPGRLCFDYSYPAIPLATGTLQDWLAWATLIAVACGAAIAFRRNRAAFFFLAFAFITILPAANLLFPIGTIMAERLTYLPSIGIVFCVVVASYRFLGRFAPYVLPALVALLLLRTLTRNADWQNDLTLSTAAVNAGSESYKVHLVRAEALFGADDAHSRVDEAVAEADRSVGLIRSLPYSLSTPAPYRVAALYHFMRGEMRKNPAGQPAPESLSDYETAADLAGRCISLTGNYDWAGLKKSDPGKFYGAAQTVAFGALYRLQSYAYLRLGEPAKALAPAERAQELDPLLPDSHRQLADTLEALGRTNDAAIALVRGILITSDSGLQLRLEELYRGSAALRECVLLSPNGAMLLNPACAAVHRDACSAANEALQITTAVGLADRARSIGNLAAHEFACAPAVR